MQGGGAFSGSVWLLARKEDAMRKTEVIKLTVTTSIKIERITQTEDGTNTTKKPMQVATASVVVNNRG